MEKELRSLHSTQDDAGEGEELGIIGGVVRDMLWSGIVPAAKEDGGWIRRGWCGGAGG